MGINEKIEKLEELIKQTKEQEEKKDKKKFKIPFSSRVGKSKAKRNYVTILKINENGEVSFERKQIDAQTFMQDGVPRLGTPDYVLRYKNNPLVILPSWSVTPFSPVEHFEKSLVDGSNINAYEIILARMIKEQISMKKPMSGLLKWIIGIGLAGLIGYALITGGGK